MLGHHCIRLLYVEICILLKKTLYNSFTCDISYFRQFANNQSTFWHRFIYMLCWLLSESVLSTYNSVFLLKSESLPLVFGSAIFLHLKYFLRLIYLSQLTVYHHVRRD